MSSVPFISHVNCGTEMQNVQALQALQAVTPAPQLPQSVAQPLAQSVANPVVQPVAQLVVQPLQQMQQVQVQVPMGAEVGQQVAFVPPGHTQAMSVAAPQVLPAGSIITVQYPVAEPMPAHLATSQFPLPQTPVQLEDDREMRIGWILYSCGCFLGLFCNPLCAFCLWTAGICAFFCKPAEQRASLPRARRAGLVTAGTAACACTCLLVVGLVGMAACISNPKQCDSAFDFHWDGPTWEQDGFNPGHHGSHHGHHRGHHDAAPKDLDSASPPVSLRRRATFQASDVVA